MFRSQTMSVRMLLCVGFIMCLIGLHTVQSAAYTSLGECPDGHKPGDSWYNGCGQCDCHEKGYSCYSCGVYSLEIDTNSCYIYHEDEKLYPECCQPKTKCRGEEGFREELLVG